MLPANVRLDWKVFARCKHSRLFGLGIINEEKKFYNIDTWTLLDGQRPVARTFLPVHRQRPVAWTLLGGQRAVARTPLPVHRQRPVAWTPLGGQRPVAWTLLGGLRSVVRTLLPVDRQRPVGGHKNCSDQVKSPLRVRFR